MAFERINLLGGSYLARFIGASAQRCVNLFPERNPKDSPTTVTHYQRPGLRPLVNSGTMSAVRGVWRSSDNQGWCVIGQNVYNIDVNFKLTKIGALAINTNKPCSFVDNGVDGLLVDGSNVGYSIHLSNAAFAQVVDPTGTFQGATRVDNIDTFIVFNFPGSNFFGSTHSASLVFDPLFVGAKADYPDALQTLIVNRHELLLLGALKSEIWYDAGNNQLPFQELPGAYIEHGTGAPYSVAAADINVYWLGQDLQGDGIVYRQRGYVTQRISNHALEVAIRKMKAAGTIADAIGFTYQQDGHLFYFLTFPTGDQTWVWDESIEDPLYGWHQQSWTDNNGLLHRHRANCYAFLNGLNVVGDWQNGTLYAMDQETFTDTLTPGAAAGPITCIRSFPHLTFGAAAGRLAPTNGHRVKVNGLMADIEPGEGALDAQGNPAQISLRYSRNRGRTFGDAQVRSLGEPGKYEEQPLWRNLGEARNWVFELSYSVNGKAALNGAWVDSEVLMA